MATVTPEVSAYMADLGRKAATKTNQRHAETRQLASLARELAEQARVARGLPPTTTDIEVLELLRQEVA